MARVAVLVIGVVLVALLLSVTSWFYEMSLAVGDEAGARMMLAGVAMLMMWLITCEVVLFQPLVSVARFVVAKLLGPAVGGGLPVLDP